MATLAELKHARKSDLVRLRALFREALRGVNRVEQEVNRLSVRGDFLPQPTDLAKLGRLAAEADSSWDKATSSIASAAAAWKG